jgi:hypothetical protein
MLPAVMAEVAGDGCGGALTESLLRYRADLKHLTLFSGLVHDVRAPSAVYFGMAQPILRAKRALTVAALALGAVVFDGEPAQAQGCGGARCVLLLGTDYGAPERFSGTIGGLFTIRDADPMQGPGHFTPLALEIRGRVGVGGYGVGIGPRVMRYGPLVGPDAKLTLTRTFSSPLNGNGQSTYLGVEVGYHVFGRVSIGVARQVDGPADRRDTIVTWSVGVEIPYGMWRW